jgi:hypothetical protein
MAVVALIALWPWLPRPDCTPKTDDPVAVAVAADDVCGGQGVMELMFMHVIPIPFIPAAAAAAAELIEYAIDDMVV